MSSLSGSAVIFVSITGAYAGGIDGVPCVAMSGEGLFICLSS